MVGALAAVLRRPAEHILQVALARIPEPLCLPAGAFMARSPQAASAEPVWLPICSQSRLAAGSKLFFSVMGAERRWQAPPTKQGRSCARGEAGGCSVGLADATCPPHPCCGIAESGRPAAAHQPTASQAAWRWAGWRGCQDALPRSPPPAWLKQAGTCWCWDQQGLLAAESVQT